MIAFADLLANKFYIAGGHCVDIVADWESLSLLRGGIPDTFYCPGKTVWRPAYDLFVIL